MNHITPVETIHQQGLEPAARTAVEYLLGLPRRAFDILYAWQERIDERHHLMALDDRTLRDLGLSRADLAKEVEKPFWRP